jgi:hypothetical protein
LASLVSLKEALPKDALLSYITISFLHTELLKRKPPYRIEAFGGAWILEEARALAAYSASWAFDAWRRYEEDAWGELRKNGQSPPETIFRSRISKDLDLVRFAVYSTVKYAISAESEFYETRMIKRAVLDKGRIPDIPVFRAEDLLENRLIFRLDIAEAVLGAGLSGIVFQDIEVV